MRKGLNGLWLVILLAVLVALPGWGDCGKCDEHNETECGTDKESASAASLNFEQKYQQAFTEIMLLNLVNGLNLTDTQIPKLIDLNKKADNLRKEYESKANELAGEVLTAYQKLKEALEKNQGIPENIEQKAFRMERQIIELKKEFESKLPGYEKEAEKILTRAQLEIINTFNPCLIPPKNLKDPVRAGQANDNEMLMNLFQRIREIPDEVFERDKDKIVRKHLEMLQEHIGKLTQDEYKEEKECFLELIEEVRNMDDVEFELNAPDMATKYMERGKKLKGEDLREEIMQLEKTRRGGVGKIGHFILNPAMAPILAKRLEMMKNTPKAEPVDLDKVNATPKEGRKK
ncbi:MAG: hypothetical protein HY811_02735 [Planctomycetes bacterium]|nr:hypothetical protein [Planctomycetota bacterium]